jgi:hypothetical protein
MINNSDKRFDIAQDREKSEMTKIAFHSFAVILLLSLIAGSFAQAEVVSATFTNYGRIYDASPQNGIPEAIINQTQTYTGDIATDSFSRYVVLFALPTLDTGEYVSDASFTAVLFDKVLNSSTVNVDVAFLEMGNSAALTTAAYSNAYTAYESGFATPSTANGSTQTWSNANLVTAISNAYGNSQSYVGFRLQYPESGAFWDANGYPKSDGDGAHDFYTFYTSGTNFYSGSNYGGPDPTLQLTVIPEPGSIGLMALSAAGLFALRRRLARR